MQGLGDYEVSFRARQSVSPAHVPQGRRVHLPTLFQQSSDALPTPFQRGVCSNPPYPPVALEQAARWKAAPTPLEGVPSSPRDEVRSRGFKETGGLTGAARMFFLRAKGDLIAQRPVHRE
jgi:hypothetical protein